MSGRQEAPGMGRGGGSRWLRRCQQVSRPGGPTLWALPPTPSSGPYPFDLTLTSDPLLLPPAAFPGVADDDGVPEAWVEMQV